MAEPRQSAPGEEEDFCLTFENTPQPLAFGNFNIQDLSGLPGVVHYYTSLTDYNHF